MGFESKNQAELEKVGRRVEFCISIAWGVQREYQRNENLNLTA